MRRVLRLLLLTLALAVALVGAAGAYLVTGGGYVSVTKASLRPSGERDMAPRWTAVCALDAPAVAGSDLCAAVSGKVVYVQRVDPDGDGDLHLILLQGTSPRLVKLQRRDRPDRIPRLGTRVVAGGWVIRGASGKAEIVARRLCRPDTTGRRCAATRAF